VDCLNDDDGVTAVLAVGALTAIGRAAVPALIEAFGGATPRARIHIMRAVAQIRDPRAINLMMQAMAQDSAALQYWAQRGLEMLGLDMVYLKPE
jgi:HEAT repeat protein